MIKILTIIGKSASGKDTLLKDLKNIIAEIDIFNKFNFVIKTTTRPKRDYELDDVDYHFITEDEFTNKLLINKDEMNSNNFTTFQGNLDFLKEEFQIDFSSSKTNNSNTNSSNEGI